MSMEKRSIKWKFIIGGVATAVFLVWMISLASCTGNNQASERDRVQYPKAVVSPENHETEPTISAAASGGNKTIHPSGPPGNHESRTGIFTAYTSRKSETDKNPYVTADGTDLRDVSRCVLAHNKLKFGTKVKVEGMGVCEVRDRMADRHGNHRFDVYMGHDVKRAKDFGRKKLQYQILQKPDGKGKQSQINSLYHFPNGSLETVPTK